MDKWLKQRIIKMHEEGMEFSAIVELTGKSEEKVQGVLGEHYAEDFNQKQKDIGLVS